MKRNEDDRQFTSTKLQNSDNKSKKNISTSDQKLFSRLMFLLQSQMTAKENIWLNLNFLKFQAKIKSQTVKYQISNST